MRNEGRIYVLGIKGVVEATGNRAWMGFHKIGWTSRSVMDRALEIQAFSPFKLSILSVFFGSEAEEGRIHSRLHRYRLHNEWFYLPEEEIWPLYERSLQWPETPDYLANYSI